MPDWVIIFFAFLIGLLAGWAAFGKTKDKNYYAGYNDGLDKAYNLRNLDEAISYAKEHPTKIVPWRTLKF